MATKASGGLVTPIDPHVIELNGSTYTFRTGDRVSPDHPAVVKNPGLFISVDSTSDELTAAQAKHHEAAVAKALAK